MEYEWDPHKAAANRRKHGVSFGIIEDFDWQTAQVIADDRRDYGESRWLDIGLIGDRLHTLAFTIRDERIRLISLRAASRKERTLYREQNEGHR
jgi:uncharacterized DUF497 family protein